MALFGDRSGLPLGFQARRFCGRTEKVAFGHGSTSTWSKEKKPRGCRVSTVPLNVVETGGTQLLSFDFQLRPVGCQQSTSSIFLFLRFKDIVPNHEHRR